MKILKIQTLSFKEKLQIQLILFSYKFKFMRKRVFKAFISDYNVEQIKNTGLCICVRNIIAEKHRKKSWVDNLELSISLAIRQGKLFPELSYKSCLKASKKHKFAPPSNEGTFFYDKTNNVNRYVWFTTILKDLNIRS
jgi:hypothetical protein